MQQAFRRRRSPCRLSHTNLRVARRRGPARRLCLAAGGGTGPKGGEMAEGASMRSISTWQQDAVFEHVADSGVSYRTDAVLPGDEEHERLGPTPMELLLGSVGGCTGVDLAGMLRKMRLSLRALRIEVNGERQTDPPRIFRRIHLLYEIDTDPIDARRVMRAVELSAAKYCSATATVARTAEVTYTVRYDGAEYERVVPSVSSDPSPAKRGMTGDR
ncbi:MAG: hypothetical protein GF330_07075 [Candidatus Eisenbacteria bacterium]|nr:hypothetical protein [Candidatus Eisenbacteria bacterium]